VKLRVKKYILPSWEDSFLSVVSIVSFVLTNFKNNNLYA